MVNLIYEVFYLGARPMSVVGTYGALYELLATNVLLWSIIARGMFQQFRNR